MSANGHQDVVMLGRAVGRALKERREQRAKPPEPAPVPSVDTAPMVELLRYQQERHELAMADQQEKMLTALAKMEERNERLLRAIAEIKIEVPKIEVPEIKVPAGVSAAELRAAICPIIEGAVVQLGKALIEALTVPKASRIARVVEDADGNIEKITIEDA